MLFLMFNRWVFNITMSGELSGKAVRDVRVVRVPVYYDRLVVRNFF